MTARLARKLAIGAIAIGGVGWLFLKTVTETNAEPYAIDRSALSGWTLVVEGQGQQALLALRPPEQMRKEVHRQVFQRTMISLFEPEDAMPIVLRREYEASLRPIFTPDEILDLAREAGVDKEPLAPVCIALAQESAAGRSRQSYYAVFDAGAISRFRSELARLSTERGGNTSSFDPGALRPMLPVAATDLAFLPTSLELGPDMKCLAPLSVGP